MSMELEQRVHFRDELRTARTAALRDAEDFDEVLFAVERLGQLLHGRIAGLGKYEASIASLAKASPFATLLPEQFPELHSEFSSLYNIVRDARNDALHVGAFARNLAGRTIELALIIEDALTEPMTTVGHFMVRGPTCASPWLPLSFARQLLLTNSFSFLPSRIEAVGETSLRLVSDYALALYLRSAPTNAERKRRLCQTLQEAVASGEVKCEKPFVCHSFTTVTDALEHSMGLPVLVIAEGNEELLGIVTPFDLL